MNKLCRLGVYNIRKNETKVIPLPIGRCLVSLTTKGNHQSYLVDLILNGNQSVLYDAPAWILERLWIPLNIHTMKYHTVYLRITNISEWLTLEIWIMQGD